MSIPADSRPRGPLQILAAAAEAISERGLSQVDIEDIARRAGVSSSVIVYYFDSKERLLAEALTLVEDRFELEEFEHVRATGSPRDHLAYLIRATCPPSQDEEGTREWRLWIELWARALRDPEAGHKREILDRRWRETIVGVVRAGQDRGEFAGVDAEEFALRLAALIDGLATQVALSDPHVSPERMLTLCLDAAARELLPEGESFRAP